MIEKGFLREETIAQALLLFIYISNSLVSWMPCTGVGEPFLDR